jgi:hypothetical protein
MTGKKKKKNSHCCTPFSGNLIKYEECNSSNNFLFVFLNSSSNTNERKLKKQLSEGNKFSHDTSEACGQVPHKMLLNSITHAD